jgi:hypothetical protein
MPQQQSNETNPRTLPPLTAAEEALAQPLSDLAQRHGFGRVAVQSMWDSIRRGDGGMAQFSHPEFGGSGQWLRGGMIMVGDMFNHAMASRVGALCDDLSDLFEMHPEWTAEVPRRLSVRWWPDDLGDPSSSGAQNGVRYAWFPTAHRLAVERDGEVSLYDTEDHRIGGVAQQQGGGSDRLSFTSEQGPIDLASLRRVQGNAG